MRNREIVFILRMRNEARRTIRALRGDLRGLAREAGRVSAAQNANVKNTRNLGRAASRSTKNVRNLSKNTKDAARNATQLSRSTTGVLGALRVIEGPLGSVSGRLTSFTGLLSSGAGLAIGFGVAIGTLTFGLVSAVSQFTKSERILLRVEGVIRATGGAAGITARQIEDFSIRLDEATLASKEGIQEAAAALATFRTIGGQAFFRTIELAGDLSELLGQDIRSAAVQLGKALEDPATGLTSLRRAGVLFTEQQQELIKGLVESGQLSEAQRVILDEVARTMGGTARRAAEGFAGDVDALGLAWRRLLDAFGGNAAEGEILPGVTNFLTDAVNFVRGFVDETERAENRLRQLRELAADRGFENILPGFQTELLELEAAERDRAITQSETARRAAAKRAAFETQRNNDAILALQKQLSEEVRDLEETGTDIAMREAKKRATLIQNLARPGNEAEIARLRELNDELRRLEIEQAQEGDQKKREQAIKRLTTEIQTLERTLDPASGRLSTFERNIRSIQRAADEGIIPNARAQELRDLLQIQFDKTAAQQAIESLKEQLTLVGLTTEERKIENDIIKLRNAAIKEGTELTATQEQQVRDLTLAIQRRNAEDTLNQNVQEQVRSLRDRVRLTGLEGLKRERLTAIIKLENDARKAGITNIEEERAALNAVFDELERAEDIRSRDALGGIEDGFKSFADSAADLRTQFSDFTETTLDDFFDNLSEGLTKGKLDFTDFTDSVLTDLQRIALNEIFTSIFNSGTFALGGTGSLFGEGILTGIFHDGGQVNKARSAKRAVALTPKSAFTNAPRFQGGGSVGRGGVPAILEPGEVVLNAAQQRNVADQLDGGITVNASFNFNGPNANVRQIQASRQQIAADLGEEINRQVRRTR